MRAIATCLCQRHILQTVRRQKNETKSARHEIGTAIIRLYYTFSLWFMGGFYFTCSVVTTAKAVKQRHDAEDANVRFQTRISQFLKYSCKGRLPKVGNILFDLPREMKLIIYSCCKPLRFHGSKQSGSRKSDGGENDIFAQCNDKKLARL